MFLISFKSVGTIWEKGLLYFLRKNAGCKQRFSILIIVCAMALPLALGVASAQTATEDLYATSSYVIPSAPSFEWAAQNRFIEIFGGQHEQNYLETDTLGLTPNGVLDTETGQQNHVGISLRWQTDNHLLVHLQAQRQSGVTDYNGYLQASNGTLSPYRAGSGNTASQISLAMGYALNASNWPVLSPRWQIIPLLQISQHQWDRNLVQYSETYTHSNYATGALLQG